MPLISEFNGIKIYMYLNDHSPPHFHAYHAGLTAKFNFEGENIKKSLPVKVTKLIRKWVKLNHSELLTNWQKILNEEKLNKITPLK